MRKNIVCYFSATGVTRNVAKEFARATLSDLFEIEPVQVYTKYDLDWTNNHSRATLEMNDKESRPMIKRKVDNLDYYEKVIIGYPIWWYTAPTIINTFIEENDLTGKKIYLFCTSGGTNVAKSFLDLKNKYPDLNFISAKNFTGHESVDDYLKWIEE